MHTASRVTRLRAVALSVGFITVVTGCSQRATSFDTNIPARQTALRIRNDSWQDVRVYMTTGTGVATVRLGTVSAASTERIRLKGSVLQQVRSRGSIRLMLRPLGSRAGFATQAVFVQPGDEIRLTVANQLTLSTLFVARRR